MAVPANGYPSAASHSYQSTMAAPKCAGSTWLTTYNGDVWPVVLCHDELPPKAFMDTRSTPYATPAILLGRHKYVWVVQAGLQAYDPCLNYLKGESQFESEHILDNDSEEVRIEKARREAFRQEAILFEDDTYWSDYIISKSKARRIEREMGIKRKRGSAEDDDEDVEILDFRGGTLSSTIPKQPRTHGPVRVGTAGGSQLPTPALSPQKGAKRDNSEGARARAAWSNDDDLFVKDTKDQRNQHGPWFEDSDDDQDSDDEDSQVQKAREKNREQIKKKPPMYNACTVFVGEEHTPFPISKDALGKCEFLKDRMQSNNELRHHINLFEEVDISAEEFTPVAQFMREREFTPRLVDRGTFQQVEKVVLPEEKDDAAETISKIYHTASKIHFGALQKSCVNKLKVLSPLSPTTLLVVVLCTSKAVSCGGELEQEIREWLVDQVAGQFFLLMSQAGVTFTRVMRENKELWRGVIGRLNDNPEMGEEGMDD